MKPLTTEQLEIKKAILAHVYRTGYQPVKPRVIAKKLRLPKDQKDDFKRSLKFLIREGKLAYGAKHLIGPVAGEPKPSAPKEQADDTSPVEPLSEKADRSEPQAKPQAEPQAKSIKLSEPAKPKKQDKPKKVEQPKKADTLNKKEQPRRTDKTKNSNQPSIGMEHVGTFRRNPRGFGFIRPEGSEGKDREDVDVFIPANRAGNASSGDLVRFELIRSSEHPYNRHVRHAKESSRLKGSIIKVIERRTTQFVGTFKQGRTITRVAIDGSLFAEPILIRKVDTLEAEAGDKVVVEVTHFPSPFNEGSGIVRKILGRADDPEVDFQTILSEFDLPDAFEQSVLDAAQKVAEAFNEDDLGGRTDLTGKTIVTIDPVDARDFDDAVSLERVDGDDWLLGVHIADVAHFVKEKSELDLTARDRATSVYLPDRVIPMLPETISNHLASLQPNKNRYTKSAFIRFSANGTFLGIEFSRTVIRSTQRLTYEEVDEFLDAPESLEEKWGTAVCGLLSRMNELAVVLRTRRFARGALELSMPDVKINLGESGEVVGAEAVETTQSHRIIEEFMLAANEAVAQELTDREIRFLRRAHGKPSPRKLEQLSQFVQELGFDIESLEDRFALQRLLVATADAPQGRAVHYAVLRSMQRATYSAKATPDGHYALATKNYCHFTSPIRRYPDLVVHRVLDRLFDGKTPSVESETLLMLAEHCSDREHRAEAAERASNQLKLIRYLEARPSEQFDAIITGVERFGVFVQGIKLPVEGLVPVESLPDDRYNHDRAAHILSGHHASNQFRLGDPIRVELAQVDSQRREIKFRPILSGEGEGVSSRKVQKAQKGEKVQKAQKGEKGREKPRRKQKRHKRR